MDFLNDKRVIYLNNLFGKYLYKDSEDCNILEEKMVDCNIELFLKVAEVLKQEKPLPQSRNWLNR